MSESDNIVIGYHGSYREITQFSALRYEGVGGIYFTLAADVAWSYAKDAYIDEDNVPTVMTASLRIRKPFPMTGIESQELTIERIAELKAQGYDAVYGMTAPGEEVVEVAVFDPDQIEITAVEARSEPEPSLPRF
ncbi:hypothetical protein GCM10011385_40960 [Nitratireductor aestuarii]|uniref:ART-PolyVal-like domain-containing protein n=1 Tax=Nitratireductor aestuarii TaxID=1735103 RepID=A0A916S3G6_9HYPH|nr:hypothetical protein [Nitratireductor aestuarii]GGA82551.1 hypothetical protein GCM10011385_40960 [Nitratireductor aestuarii]